MDHAEFGENTRQYVAEFVRFADAKAGALLTFSSVVSATLGALCAPSLARFREAHSGWSWVALAAALPFVVSTVMTVMRSVESLSPRTPAADESLASFPDIAAMESAEFLSRSRALPASSIADQYTMINWQLSRVAAAKYAALSKAAWWLRIQIFSAYVAGLACAAVIGLGG